MGQVDGTQTRIGTENALETLTEGDSLDSILQEDYADYVKQSRLEPVSGQRSRLGTRPERVGCQWKRKHLYLPRSNSGYLRHIQGCWPY